VITQVDLDWLLTHLDDVAYRTFQHLLLTAIAVGVGFVISFGLAVIAVRRRATSGPILAVSDLLYTLTIFVRNIATGLREIPPDVLEAADGLGFSRRQRLWRVEVPLAVPLIVAGVRLATVSTIGLVTVTAVMGDSFGGLGYFILEGYRRGFPLELYVGAIPSIALAFAVDAVLVRSQHRLTPWAVAA
jgi:osmoprotectant transport system permease protein